MADSRKGQEPPEEDVKVVDRRRFTAEGELRSDVTAQPPQPPPSPSPPPADAPPAASTQAEKAYENRRPAGEPKMDFRTLVMSLSTSAMFQLGLIAEAGSPPPPPDFEAARQSIDMLAVLEEKTRGNLNPDEKRLVEQVLYELRVAYASLTRK